MKRRWYGAPALRHALVLRLVWGVTLLFIPARVLRALGAPDTRRRAQAVMRILGCRHVVQAGSLLCCGDIARRLGLVADALHALSDVAFAAMSPSWRHPALGDAAITTGLAVMDVRLG